MEEKWICDYCGDYINSESNGRLEWLNIESTSKNHSLKIVHHDPKCVYNQNKLPNEAILNRDLTSLVSQDGFMGLLALISENNFKDNEELLEIIKRIFIKNYDIARRYFSRAINEGYFDPNMKPNYYNKRDIDSTLEFMKDNDILQ